MNKDLVKNDFNSIFPSFFDDGFRLLKGFGSEFEQILNGKCDFEESENEYVVELEVPGVKKEEIDISLKKETLTINWNRKNEKKSKIGKSKYERSEGSFSRSFSVEGANSEKIEAELKNGVLKIVVPKLEKVKAKNITIK